MCARPGLCTFSRALDQGDAITPVLATGPESKGEFLRMSLFTFCLLTKLFAYRKKKTQDSFDTPGFLEANLKALTIPLNFQLLKVHFSSIIFFIASKISDSLLCIVVSMFIAKFVVN